MYLEACLHNADNSLPLLPPSAGFWVWRRRLSWKRQPVTLQQSGGNPTLGRADTSRVGSPSLWCVLHMCIRGPGWRSTRLASIARSGKTAPGSTYSGKRAERSKGQAKTSPRPTPYPYHCRWPKPIQVSTRDHQKSAGRSYMTRETTVGSH